MRCQNGGEAGASTRWNIASRGRASTYTYRPAVTQAAGRHDPRCLERAARFASAAATFAAGAPCAAAAAVGGEVRRVRKRQWRHAVIAGTKTSSSIP